VENASPRAFVRAWGIQASVSPIEIEGQLQAIDFIAKFVTAGLTMRPAGRISACVDALHPVTIGVWSP